MIHLMFVHYTFSSVWVAEWSPFENRCPLVWPFVLNVFCVFFFLFISHFGSQSGMWLLITPVPVHCFNL